MTEQQAPTLREAFGSGPFHVESRTNACADVCDERGRVIVTCSWSTDATKRAEAICAARAKNIDTASPSDSERIRQLETALERAIALATPQPSPAGTVGAPQASPGTTCTRLSVACAWPECGDDCRFRAQAKGAPQASSETATPSLPLQEPVAWLHEVQERSGKADGYMRMYSASPENPWSHWVESRRDKCEHKATPLYAAPSLPAVLTDATQLRAILGWAVRQAQRHLYDTEAVRAEEGCSPKTVEDARSWLALCESSLRALATSATPVLP